VSLAADARIVWRMLRGASRSGKHVERLQRFYAPQADGYDAFRERLLHGRRDLIERLPAGPGSRVIELGCGTARTLEFFGDRLATFESVEAVDLCPALLTVAQRRVRNWRNVSLIEADVTEYRPASEPDCVYFCYALTMVPNWRRAIDNAIAMLKPGGVLGVVDFHLPAGNIFNALWRAWFQHDGVWLSALHLPYLRNRLETVACEQRRGAVPYLPAVRAPYYLFVGRKA